MAKCMSLFLTFVFNNALTAAQEKYIPIDWSNFPENEAEESKTNNVPIQIRDYATCACNLTPLSCDLSCCCDTDCKNEQRLQFVCTTVQSKNLPLASPNITNPLLQYFDNFLQVHTEITPYLGEFYSHHEIVRNMLAYSETVAKENLTRRTPLLLDTLDASEFKYGAAVKMVNDFGDIQSLQTSQSSGLGTTCTVGSPIKFGVPYTTRCLRTVNRQLCRIGTVLDYMFYAGSENGFNILTSPGVNGTDISARVRFSCAGGSTTIGRNISSEILNILLNDSSISFDDEPIIACKLLSPVFDEPSGLCKNVAHHVSYQFVWKGQLITDLLIDVNATDFPIETPIFQTFDVKWSHRVPATNQDTFPPHGFYTAGSFVYATTLEQPKSNATIFLSANAPKRYKIFKASVNGMCDFAQFVDAKFGTNAEGSCFVSLTRADFKDCASVRDKVIKNFQPVLDNNYLAKNLKVNGTSIGLDSLVEILKENFIGDPSDEFPTPHNFPLSERTWPTSCHFVPAVVTIWIQYAEVVHLNGTSLYEIVGSLLTFDNITWVYKTHEASAQFLITNRILFTKLPAKIVPQNRFYLNKDNLPFCLNSPTLSVCWDELFYPFTSDQTYSEHVYSTVVGLGTILIAIATYLVTKPWF